jgi:hypothetical protein
LLLLLLHSQNRTPWAAMVALTEQLRSMQVDADVAWHLARRTGNKRLANPDTAQQLVEQAEAHAKLLGVDRDTVLKLSLQGHSLKVLAPESKARLQMLSDLLQLHPADARRLALSQPQLLRDQFLEQIPARMQALQQILPDLPLKQLQGAVAKHGAVLLLTPLLLQQRWDVVQRYCRTHEPSAGQLQQAMREPGILRILTAPRKCYRMLEYFLGKQLQQQHENHGGNAGAAASSAMSLLWVVLGASAEEFEQIEWEMSGYREWREWCECNPRGGSSGSSSGSSIMGDL